MIILGGLGFGAWKLFGGSRSVDGQSPEQQASAGQQALVDWEGSPSFKKIQFCMGELSVILKNTRYPNFNQALADLLRCCMNYQFLWDIDFTPSVLEQRATMPTGMPTDWRTYLPEQMFRDRWIGQLVTFLSHAPGTEKGLTSHQKTELERMLSSAKKAMAGFSSFEQLSFYNEASTTTVERIAGNLSLQNLKAVFLS